MEIFYFPPNFDANLGAKLAKLWMTNENHQSKLRFEFQQFPL